MTLLQLGENQHEKCKEIGCSNAMLTIDIWANEETNDTEMLILFDLPDGSYHLATRNNKLLWCPLGKWSDMKDFNLLKGK